MKNSSLNHTYRLIWNAARQAWMVVSELTKSQGKSKAVKNILCIASMLALPMPQIGYADVTGGVVTSGSGTIVQSGQVTTINQQSQTLNLNWNTFNINQGQTVNFVQPSSTALAVNQILDTNGSRILGSLNANGIVWLINPNGVFFGQGAQVNVGSILASTLNPLSTTDSSEQVFGNGGKGKIVNKGNIQATDGGYVAFIGNSVSNQGTIVANNGTVALAGASQVTLSFADNSLYKINVDQSTLNNLAENKELIQADGGAVFLSAGAKQSLLASVVNNEGIIEAQTIEDQEGKIVLLAGMAAGTTKVSGTLDASAETGDGGFIETSGATVNVANSASITTKANNLDNGSGKNGTWLIDPLDFTIAASGGNVTGALISAALANNDVIIETADTTTSCTGVTCTTGTSGNGDIFVNDTISWVSDNDLTLSAYRNIYINQSITAEGATAKLNLEYGQGSSATGNTADYYVNAKVNLQAGQNFSTKLGSDGTTVEYTVITDLGEMDSITTTDLQGINGNLSGNYVLGADIDASETSTWTNSGFCYIGGEMCSYSVATYSTSTSTSAGSFSGIFDGLGHEITNLSINQQYATDAVGLFSSTTASAVIQNVGLVDANIRSGGGASALGGLVGRNQGTIKNAYVTGSVEGSSTSNVGGLVGRNESGGTIINAYSTASVYGFTDTGGLVGYNSGSIEDAYATGEVLGGSYGQYAGGLVGQNNSGTITNAYATGLVSGNYYVGGLVGKNQSGDITNAYAKGAVSGLKYLGGLVGANDNGSTITNAYATGSVTGGDSVSGGESVGGLVGYNIDSSITNAYATGQVSGTTYIGGLVGYSTGTSITNAYATGAVSASATNGLYVGGLVGSDSSGTITNAYATGMVSGYRYVGGLVGQGINSDITNAYATGAVSGDTFLGGLVGFMNGSLTNAYATGAVSGDASIGGLVGSNGGVVVTYGYYAGSLTSLASLPLADNVIGARRTIAQLASALPTGFASTDWANADNQTTPYLLSMGNFDVAGSVYLGTDATASTAYKVIINVNQLQAINNALSDNYVLGNNIDASATATWNSDGNGGYYGFNPLGNGDVVSYYPTYIVNVFTGTFDGLGHVIKNLTINREYTNNGEYSYYSSSVGLFGYTGTSAVIQNVGLVDANITGYFNVGGLVGTNLGQINTSFVTGQVKGGFTVGGLVGANGGVIQNTYFTGEVSAIDDVGGLVGWNALMSSSERVYEGLIEDSYADSSITMLEYSSDGYAETPNKGGLVGLNSIDFGYSDPGVGTVNNSFWNTDTEATDNGVGTGKTTTQMQTLSTLTDAGWSISNTGEAVRTTVWRIYAGHTSPLLRRFLKYNNLSTTTTTYNGTSQSNSSVLTDSLILGIAATGTNAGTYTNDYYSSQLGYDLAGGDLQIDKAEATVTANSSTVTYNGQLQTVTGYQIEGLVNNEQQSNLIAAEQLDISTAYGSGTNAGEYTHTASGNAQNYNLTFVNGKLTIDKAEATVTANSSTVTYNGQLQTVTGYQIEGLVNNEQQSNLIAAEQLDISTAYGSGTNAGEYTHTASGNAQNYNLTFVNGKLTIDKAEATVTANSSTVTYNGQLQTVTGYQIEGLVNNEQQSNLIAAEQLDISTAYGSGTNAGEYTHTASGNAQNYNLTFVNGKLTIDKAEATVTANSSTVTYNGQLQTVTGYQIEGLVNNEQQSNLIAAEQLDISTAYGSGTNAGEYTHTASGNAQNYNLTFVNGKLTIDKAEATVTANSSTVTYNGQLQTVTGYQIEGLVNNEQQSNLIAAEQLDISTAYGSGTNAGEYTHTASGNAQNYNLTFVNGKLTIDKAEATVTANSSTVTYNGQLQTVTGYQIEGLVNNEQQSNLIAAEQLDISTAYGSGTNAGEYTHTASGNAQNYNLTFVNGKLTIDKAEATVTANSSTVTYNGQLQTVTGYQIEGLVNNEQQSNLIAAEQLDISTAYGSGTNAGEYTHTASGNAQNYNLTFVNGKLTIDKAEATVTANSSTVTYNGQLQTVTGYQIEGLVNNEQQSNLIAAEQLDISTAYGSGTNAGEYTHTASGNAQNYNLTFVNGKLTIDKAEATVTANSSTVTYNGQLQTVTGYQIEGLVNNEQQSNLIAAEQLDISTAYGSGTNAGEYTHTASGNAQNYNLTFVNGKLTIDKAEATVTANSSTVTYNGQLQTVTGYQIEGLVNNEQQSNLIAAEQLDISTAYGSGTNAGEYTHTASGNAQNYNLTFVNGKLTIDKAEATVTANSSTVTYNGQLQTVTGYQIEGLVNNEQQSNLIAAEQLDISTAYGSGTNAGEYTHTASGNAQNYNLTFVNGKLTIDKAEATVTANSSTVTYNGQLQTVTGYQIEGLVNNEQQSNLIAAEQLDISTAYGSGTNAGEYTHTASGNAQNYNLTFVNGKLTIDKAEATVTANSSTVTYNGQLQTVTGYQIEGLVNNEQQSNLIAAEQLDISTAYGSGTNAGEYTHTASGNAQNYNLTFVNGKLTIDKAEATVTANSSTVTYNGQLQTVTGYQIEGLVNNEQQSNLIAAEQLDISTAYGSGTNAGEYTHTASGNAQNYNLTFVNGKLTIDKAEATVTANSSTVTYNGQLQTVTGYQIEGLVNNEQQSNLIAAEQLDISTAYGSGTNAGEYTHTASGNAQNYNLTFVNGKLTIGKATLTYVATPVTVQQGQTPSLTGTVTGFVGSESFATEFGEQTANWGSPNYVDQVGTYSVNGSGLESTNYQFVQAEQNLTALIVQSNSTTTKKPDLTDPVSNTQQTDLPTDSAPNQTPPPPYQQVDLDITPGSGGDGSEDDTLYDVIQTFGCSV